MDTTFKRNVKKSFAAAREDMNTFKSTMQAWILEFQRENQALRDEIKELRSEIKSLQKEQLNRL
ncbi:MAG: hypothetical protein ACLFPQ_05750 [Candidatus Woesearchaeota archaeon]